RTQSPAERSRHRLTASIPGAEQWDERDIIAWVEAKAQFNLATVEYAFADTHIFTTWQQSIGQVSCPILLMTGNPQHGSAATAEGIQAIQAAWQQGEHVIFEDAGHCISRDAFIPYIATISHFLRQMSNEPN
ncbi:MAG: hypothetical protein HC837_20770, partial [Chloroflexaceae bacterium]|nr:hypothetical protein [Chloroflexaceae bacterium]